jgi:alkaline phosphatase
MFIGDGMGLHQTHLTERFLAEKANKPGVKILNFNKFPSYGHITTFPTDQFITGSAAAGTALACGEKTSMKSIGMASDKKRKLESVAEFAKKQNMKVGIISSASIDHATPACFYAHQPHRKNYYEISLELADSNFDYFAGGGFLYPDGNPKKSSELDNYGKSESRDTNKEKINSYTNAKNKSYTIIRSKEEFQKLKKGANKIIAINPNLADGESLPYDIDSKKDDIKLSEFTTKGIELLDNPNGFFMMIESGKIDWACHSNDAVTTIHEVLELEKSVEKALEFYKKHKDETLIIVTADHETGGLGLGFTLKGYKSNYDLFKYQNISSEEFAILFDKKMNEKDFNFEQALKMSEQYFGLNKEENKTTLTEYEISVLQKAFADSYKKNKTAENKIKYSGNHPYATANLRILSNKAGVAWTSFYHSASPVPIRAIGNSSDKFAGYYHNNEVALKIKELLRN